MSNSAFPRLTVVMAHLAFDDFAACALLARNGFVSLRERHLGFPEE